MIENIALYYFNSSVSCFFLMQSANHEQVKLSTKIHELKKDMDIKNIKIQSGEDKILRLIFTFVC